jgi:hypothetical protein
MAKEELRVSFRITGFACSPEEISKVLGIAATETWRSGDAVQRTQMRRHVNGWVLRSDIEDITRMEPHVVSLLGKLPTDLASLSSVCGTWEAELACAVYTREQMPELNLSSKTVARLAQLGAAVDVDVSIVA